MQLLATVAIFLMVVYFQVSQQQRGAPAPAGASSARADSAGGCPPQRQLVQHWWLVSLGSAAAS